MKAHFNDPLNPGALSPRAAPALPRRTLFGLLVLVLFCHFVVLQSFSAPSLTRIGPVAGSFQTRWLAAPIPVTSPSTTAPVQVPATRIATPPAAATTPPAVAPQGLVEPVNAALVTSEIATTPVAALPDAPPLTLPRSRKLLYRLSGVARGSSYSANSEMLWQHEADSYNLRAEIGALLSGSRVQTSVGALTPQGLAPRRFGDKRRSEVAAHFERDKGLVIFSANTQPAVLLPGAQDHLSLFIQLASLLAGDPARYLKGSVIELQAVGARDADIWQFIVQGEELLQLPGGEMTAIKLSRAAQRQFDVTVEMWLAPQLDYLPARIRLTQNNGDFTDQQWRESETP